MVPGDDWRACQTFSGSARGHEPSAHPHAIGKTAVELRSTASSWLESALVSSPSTVIRAPHTASMSVAREGVKTGVSVPEAPDFGWRRFSAGYDGDGGSAYAKVPSRSPQVGKIW